jgi:hypothetical protein
MTLLMLKFLGYLSFASLRPTTERYIGIGFRCNLKWNLDTVCRREEKICDQYRCTAK